MSDIEERSRASGAPEGEADDAWSSAVRDAFAPEPWSAARRSAFDRALDERLREPRHSWRLAGALAGLAAAAALAFFVVAPFSDSAPQQPLTAAATAVQDPAAGSWDYEVFFPAELDGPQPWDEEAVLSDELEAIAAVFLDV